MADLFPTEIKKPELRQYQAEIIDEITTSAANGNRRIEAVMPTGEGKCFICGKETIEKQKWRILYFKKIGRFYCSANCADIYKRKVASITMTKTNKKYALEFSKATRKRNTLFRPDVIKKREIALKAMGWKPMIRGGNGKDMPLPQKLLAIRLGWVTEFIVPTSKKRISGYPTHYKIDIANKLLKIAIEIDGNSHFALFRKIQDRRKDEFLKSLGWIVLRFRNNDVLKNIESCLSTISSVVETRELT